MNLLPPATKLGQGYIFTGVCDSVHRGGVCSQGGLLLGVPGPGGVCSRGYLLLGGSAPGGWRSPPGTATAAGGTHPTGMHSCFEYFCRIDHNSVLAQLVALSNRSCVVKAPGLSYLRRTKLCDKPTRSNEYLFCTSATHSKDPMVKMQI